MEYGQFCPIAKATEIIGEKWTVLIIRELLMGGRRFNELQRGLSLISPTILSRRLDSLARRGQRRPRPRPRQPLVGRCSHRRSPPLLPRPHGGTLKSASRGSPDPPGPWLLRP